MKFTRTRIESGVDLDAEGKHYGFLRIPHPDTACPSRKLMLPWEDSNDGVRERLETR